MEQMRLVALVKNLRRKTSWMNYLNWVTREVGRMPPHLQGLTLGPVARDLVPSALVRPRLHP